MTSAERSSTVISSQCFLRSLAVNTKSSLSVSRYDRIVCWLKSRSATRCCSKKRRTGVATLVIIGCLLRDWNRAVSVELFVCLLKQLGRRVEINFGAGHRSVAQIGCQQGQLGGHVDSLAIPGSQPIHGKAMSEVMDLGPR